MKIGELAKAASTPVETVRYYERAGLMPPPPRTDSNYRVYGPEQVERLAFIRHCRTLDMTLEEIRVLLRFKDAPDDNCGTVNALLDAHIGHVSTRIRELKALEKQLRRLSEKCRESVASADCGILAGLTRDASLSEASDALLAGDDTTGSIIGTVKSLGHVHGSHRQDPRPGKSRSVKAPTR